MSEKKCPKCGAKLSPNAGYYALANGDAHAVGSRACLGNQLAAANAKVKEHETFRADLDALRAEEGASILIGCDNPDAWAESGCAVDVEGSWTDWKPRRFNGDNLAEAVRKAAQAKAEPCETCGASGEVPANTISAEKLPCPECKGPGKKGGTP